MKARERYLTDTTHLRDGGITFWVLVDSPSHEPLCACETYNHKKGLVKAPGQPLKEVPVLGIASVFTPAKNRGKGYAATMMKMLADKIKTEKVTGFSVLWSDVGPNFYVKRGGWMPADGTQVVFPSTMNFDEDVPLVKLTLEQAKAIMEVDVESIKQKMAHLETDNTIIRMVPQHAELEWCVTRDRYMAKHMNVNQSEHVGAFICSGSDKGYVLWFHEWKDSALIALRFQEPATEREARGLLRALVDEARATGLKTIAIWSPSDRIEKLTGVNRSERDQSLPAVLYFGDASVHWENPEKLSWC